MKKLIYIIPIVLLMFLMIGCKNKGNDKTSKNEESTPTYTIMFNADGGTLVSGKEIQKVTKASEIIAPTYQKEGYIFKGFDKDLTTLSSDCIVNALWELATKTYKVTFEPNGGKLMNGKLVQTISTPEEIIAPTLEKEGYIFKGFDKDFSTITDTTTIYAIWEEITSTTYTITFNFNGGTSSSERSKQITSLDANDFPFDVAKENYIFRGWSYNGKVVIDELGNILNNVVLFDGMVFTATFSQNVRINIVPNINDAGTTVTDQEYKPNSIATISAVPSQGYEFVGWYQENTLLSTEQNYNYQINTSDVTLEARFKLASFELNVSSNSEKGIVAINPETDSDYSEVDNGDVIYTNGVIVSAKTKDDTEFLGWFDTNNNLVSKNNVYSFTMPNNDYALIAKWNYFRIDYDLNDGVNSTLNPDHYTLNSNDIILEPATKTGYTFNGWFSDNELITTIDSSMSINYTLTASFTPNTYRIIYDSPIGTVGTNTQTVLYDTTYALSVPTRVGYTFNGWYIDSTLYTAGVWNFDCDQTFTAKWTINSFDITYILDDGTNNSNNPSSYTVEDNITLQPASKEGYSFEGWFDNDSFNGNSVITIDKGKLSNITLYAKWDVVLYNITYELNGSENSTFNPSTYTIEDSIEFQPATKDGLIFYGWYKESTFKHQIVSLSNGSIGDLKLYPRFLTEQEYWDIKHGIIPTLSEDGNTLTFGMYPQTHVNDEDLIEELNKLDPSVKNSQGYYLYNGEYYYSFVAIPYVSTYFFKDGTAVIKNNKYWFKVEPISWNILKEEDGTYKLLSTMLLNTKEKENEYTTTYDEFFIRDFLNNDFYNRAFNEDQMKLILTTVVDNSLASTASSSNQYTCNDTNDKVYLLSLSEVINSDYGFNENRTNHDLKRQAKVTDFTIAAGAYYSVPEETSRNGVWWLRTTYYDSRLAKYCIDSTGGTTNRSAFAGAVSIRPAITIVLE